MVLPNFLLIGAMKAGTTSLYRELLRHPDVAFPSDKEPGDLARDEVLTARGRARYERKFARLGATVIGDASTNYAKLPDIAGVAERARQLLGEDVRIAYSVREPIARALSHHRHLLVRGEAGPDINAELARHPEFVDYSRYHRQLEPWLEAFGSDAVRVLVFEDYVADRSAYLDDLFGHLGLSAQPVVDLPPVRMNASAEAPPAKGLWQVLRRFPPYRRLIRPRLTLDARADLRKRLIGSPDAVATPATARTVSDLAEALRADVDALSTHLGRPDPVWDLDEVVASHASS